MNAKHTIIGMPGAGKTTYLAALWHLVSSGEVETSLVLDKLEGDVSYLNDMVESWQHCEKVRRTTSSEDHPVVIHLKNHSSETAVLSFTDLSGEKFEQQFARRVCDPEYVEEINSGGGLLLFINADRGHKGITIHDAGGLLDGADEESLVEWEPGFVSEQAQLVDLLQCLQKPPFVSKQRKIVVIISAWDVVTNRATPEEWLRIEMPYLSQFLKTSKVFEHQMFGVSAQGGIIQTDANGKVIETTGRTELLRKTPSKRITCVGQGFTSSDITIPLCWLSGITHG